MQYKYGHVGLVTGSKTVNSPCCKAKPILVELQTTPDGFTPVIDLCSVCGKKYQSTELTIIDHFTNTKTKHYGYNFPPRSNSQTKSGDQKQS
jgi:hypothetical protein